MKMFAVVVTVLVAGFFTSTTARPADGLVGDSPIYLNCSKYPPPKQFSVIGAAIPDCKAPPCTFKRGDTAKMNITMKALEDIPADKSYFKMCGDIKVACPTLDPAKSYVCDLGAKCPIKKGDVNVIQLSIPIDKSYPKLTIPAYLYVETDDKDTDRDDEVACIEVEIKLV